MKAAIIIPARFGSTRLPGKMLLRETGRPLIQHAYEQALKVTNAGTVIVATDDERIKSAVSGFGGRAILTRNDHRSGTARVAEAARTIDADIVVNLQGDEPEISPCAIEKVIAIKARHECFAATLACPFPRAAAKGAGSPGDPAAVKAILGKKLEDDIYYARYFTRNVCVYPRNDDGGAREPEKYYLHLGLYAFNKPDLEKFAEAPPGAVETGENLEQLRILEMGEKIAVGIVSGAAPGIDTDADYAAFVKRWRDKT